jgi:hypothetical protein
MGASHTIGGSQAKGETKTSSRAANTLTDLAVRFAGETTGVRTGLIDAMQEVLTSGGSSIPIISRSVEQSRMEGSKALSDLDKRLALTGLAGTPEGEGVRSETQLANQIAAGQTQQSLAQQIFAMIPNLVLGQAQTASSGLSGAIPGTLKEKSKGNAMGTSHSGSFSAGSMGGGGKG